MGDMLRETNADLAAKTGVDEVEPPTPEPSPDPADHAPEPTPEGGAKPEDESATPTEAEVAAEQQRQADEAAAAAESDEEKKKKEEADAQKQKDEEAKKAAAAAPAKAKTPEEEAREKRDADLNPNLSPHTHPKTRQIITSFKENARKARDERDAAARERDALKQQLAEVEQKSKGVALPKEVDEELKTLRERVRELDISRDPQIEAKYDKPIAKNNAAVIALLKDFGAHHIEDPRDKSKTIADPRFEANLLRSGLTLNTLKPFIDKLDAAGYANEAETLREAVRENMRLARGKQEEIETFKANYDERIKTRTSQSQQQTEQEAKAFAAEAEAALSADVTEMKKNFAFLNEPPAPLPTDSDPVRKAKQAAVDEYNAAKQAIEQAVTAINPAGLAPDKARSAAAKLNATAVQGVIYKLHVIPRLQKELSARDARIKELEAQIGKIKGATNLSKQHATLAAQPSGGPEIPANTPTENAFAAFAKAAGVNVGT